ncbi:CAAX amino terminal membrane bound protease [Williamsoniiplasma luminosum]|uniref:CAAX amino terminal membrane bound protease n=1 Tax=Williamsoniiplasma luminosum TaxID=214888 RepID=A0A2K8NSL9_9MOLU|nr:CPBP family intramembrane glutamic endopeptidase [Williamsoniiplasma luminosum]ATZ16767.1 CAAX amino terminal membrane bound protease [Williamsoniiplasma luminosum]
MDRKSVWEKISIPSSETNTKYPFYFNLYNYKTNGIIFVITGLILPLISLIMFRFIGGMSTPAIDEKTNAQLVTYNFLVSFASTIIGLVFLLIKDKALFFKSGLFIFYGFQLFVPLIGVLLSTFVSLINFGSEWKNIIFLWFQIIAEIIVAIVALYWTTDLKTRIISTFKKDWLKILIVILVGIGLMIGIGQLYGFLVKGTALGEDSQNQSELIGLINNENPTIRITYIISLFVLTILIAPLVEEMAMRHAVYVGCGNRTIALFVSALMFGMIHVNSGDVEHILSYVLSGLVFSTIFSVCRGNVTYTWLTHAGYNAFAFVLLFIN